MKVKDLLAKYKNKLDKLNKIADNYYDKYYCGYLGEWMCGSSEKEYNKLKQDIVDYLNSEAEL